MRLITCLALGVCFVCCAHVVLGAQAGGVGSPSAVVMRLSDRSVLFESDSNKKIIPASLAKIVTIHTALREVASGSASLYDFIVVSREAALQPASKIGLQFGSRVRLINLLLAMIVVSANDASLAVAHNMGGFCGFVGKMNAILPSIGMNSSKFANPSGLDDWFCVDNRLYHQAPSAPALRPDDGLAGGAVDAFAQPLYYTTATDVANGLARLIEDYPELTDAFRMPYFVWGGIVYPGTNNIGRYLSGSLFGKTGHTIAAGYNLATALSFSKKGGGKETIVAVATGMSSRLERDDYVVQMLDLGVASSPGRGRGLFLLDLQSRAVRDKIDLLSSFGNWVSHSLLPLPTPIRPSSVTPYSAMPSGIRSGRAVGPFVPSSVAPDAVESHDDASADNCWLIAKSALKQWYLRNTVAPYVGRAAAHSVVGGTN